MLVLALGLQLTLSLFKSPPMARAEDLTKSPSPTVLRLISLGERPALARILMLWLQNFDNQPGLAIPFRNLNYEAVASWLTAILALDPKSEYPLFAALRFYVAVPDKTRIRRMLVFLQDHFAEDPKNRWRWLAFAAVVARHRLKDNALAHQFLDDIASKVSPTELPQWVLGVRLSLMREMGELASARILVGSLLHHKEINDPHQIQFLTDWLEKLEAEGSQ